MYWYLEVDPNLAKFGCLGGVLMMGIIPFWEEEGVSLVAKTVRNPSAMWNLGLIPGLGRSRGEGNGYRLQYSCLENSMDRGLWRATVHGVTKSQRERLHDWETFTLNSIRGKDPWRRKRLPIPVLWLGVFMDCIVAVRSQTVGHNWATFTKKRKRQNSLFPGTGKERRPYEQTARRSQSRSQETGFYQTLNLPATW